jgi:hypothetical protein
MLLMSDIDMFQNVIEGCNEINVHTNVKDHNYVVRIKYSFFHICVPTTEACFINGIPVFLFSVLL